MHVNAPPKDPTEASPDWVSRNRPLAVAIEIGGRSRTYADLADNARRLLAVLRTAGLHEGDAVATFVQNTEHFAEIVWACRMGGFRYTPINSHLTVGEAAFILSDCEARALVADHSKRQTLEALQLPTSLLVAVMIGGTIEGFRPYEACLRDHSPGAVNADNECYTMMYSSGTTGRPKGVRRSASRSGSYGQPDPTSKLIRGLFGIDGQTRYLCTGPQYHATPLSFLTAAQRYGGTVIQMPRFDSEEALRLIETHRITHATWVATMFVRMLRLPDHVRARYDLSSMKYAVHSAAPTPVPVKEAMLKWWGPIVYEYYGGTEGIGHTFINSTEWQEHKGSVGRPIGCTVHIVGDDGRDLPAGEIGTIYFGGGAPFEYHNDPVKTEQSRHPNGWATLGDIGFKDRSEFLYLTDRRDDVIISGGVNIYPQEIEQCLVLHPKVRDVAVFGVPNEEYGEEVKAIVLPEPDAEPGSALSLELIAICHKTLAAFKIPRTIDFVTEFPRTETGKVKRHVLREPYWSAHRQQARPSLP